MADEYCSACNKLKELNGNFVLNGITQSMYNSLKNNTGLTATLKHDNCEDLNDINDCLLGSLYDKIDAYDVCDWKEFMKEYLVNQQTVNQALIASDCGQWEQIEAIWKEINKLQQEINNLWIQVNASQYGIKEVLQKLNQIGVWTYTGDNIFNGNFVSGMGIAGGNINLFGGSADGGSWIRTNPGTTDNDLAGGIGT